MGEIICITSGKGGVGKSTISIGISEALSRMGKRVLLIDADLSLGYDAYLLKVEPSCYIQDVFDRKCKVAHCMYKIQEDFYFAASNNTGGDPTGFELLVRACNKAFDYIILDLPAGMPHEVFKKFDRWILVAEPRVASVTVLQKIVEEIGDKNCSLIVNKISKNDYLNTKEVSEFLGIEVLGTLAENADLITLGDKINTTVRTNAYKYFRNIAERIEDPTVSMIQFKASWWNKVALF